VGKVKCQISVSADGFVAGPNQSEEHGLGEGGEALHEWAIATKRWREQHGLEGGTEGADSDVIEEHWRRVGATVMGRRMFSGGAGPWEDDPNANGWWGDDPPFHHDVYVLTSNPREPLEMEGGTTFVFVTDGIESAIGIEIEAAGEKDVQIHGGGTPGQQALAAGALDERAERVELKRLGDVVKSAAAHRLDGAVDRAEGGHDDDGHRRIELLDPTQHLEPVGALHAQVRHDHVGRLPRELLERRHPAVGDRGREARRLQIVRDRARHVDDVVDHQHAHGAAGRHACASRRAASAGHSTVAVVPDPGVLARSIRPP